MGKEITNSSNRLQEALRIARRVLRESIDTDPDDPLVIVSQELLRHTGDYVPGVPCLSRSGLYYN